MLLDGVITFLGNNSGVNALVQGRIYKNVLPRDYALPALAIHRYGGSQEQDFNGPVTPREYQIQIDAYGQDATSCQQTVEAVRTALNGFVGTLPDGSPVSACYLEREMDMPFLPHADQKGIADRALLGFRIVSR